MVPNVNPRSLILGRLQSLFWFARFHFIDQHEGGGGEGLLLLLAWGREMLTKGEHI